MNIRKTRTPGEQEEPAESVREPVAENLQHPDTIDAKKLDSPVLTSKGWVCPDLAGRNKAKT